MRMYVFPIHSLIPANAPLICGVKRQALSFDSLYILYFQFIEAPEVRRSGLGAIAIAKKKEKKKEKCDFTIVQTSVASLGSLQS